MKSSRLCNYCDTPGSYSLGFCESYGIKGYCIRSDYDLKQSEKYFEVYMLWDQDEEEFYKKSNGSYYYSTLKGATKEANKMPKYEVRKFILEPAQEVPLEDNSI